ncbi:ATP synthase subunit delta, sodium ion specific [bacterium HR21]|nr:ATP synthase subunit delta, sodium ion specific [bacterium HR21]
MSPLRIARRYATALLKLAQESQEHERIYEELCWLRRIVQSSSELRAFLRNPIIRSEQKRAVIRELLAPHVSPLLVQFLMLLIEKRREALLPDIIAAYEELYYQYTDRLAVLIRSAVPLEEELQARLVAALHERTGKTIVPSFAVDPTLLGGVQLQIGDTVIDGTLRHALERLRRELLERMPVHWLRTHGDVSLPTDHQP